MPNRRHTYNKGAQQQQRPESFMITTTSHKVRINNQRELIVPNRRHPCNKGTQQQRPQSQSDNYNMACKSEYNVPINSKKVKIPKKGNRKDEINEPVWPSGKAFIEQ